MSKDFQLFYEKAGIRHKLIAPYTPQQNGMAERKNRTLVDKARSMMSLKNTPVKFWAKDIATVVYLCNLSPTIAVLNRTPFEAWNGFNHLRILVVLPILLLQFNIYENWTEGQGNVFLLGTVWNQSHVGCMNYQGQGYYYQRCCVQ